MSDTTMAVRNTNTGARARRIVIKSLEYAALLLACFIALLPVWSSFTTSFKTAEEYATTNAMTLPQNWLNFGNYEQVWTEGDMLRAFLTSASVVLVVVTVSVMMGSMLAYVLNRFRFPGNGLIRNLFMIATVISIYIFLQYFENLDGALDESAVLEGCTYFGVFFRILLPLTKPAIITVAVLKGVGVYNEYYSANLYLQSNSWRTISTALYSFSGPFKSSYNIICAGVLLTLIPSLIVFLVFQKQVYAGLASGSVMG